MKPKEFDELFRQKFDQNDFEYNPRSWERLEEQLDGRSKRRSIIMWWLMPVAGIAASVALAMGVAPLLKYNGAKPGAGGGLAKVQKTEVVRPAQAAPHPDNAADNIYAYNTGASHANHHAAAKADHRHPAGRHMNEDNGEDVVINLRNALPSNNKASRKAINVNLLDESKAIVKKDDKEKKKQLQAEPQPMATFKPDEEIKRQPTMSVILSGGYNQGSQISGYAAAATIRKNVTEHVFIESDLGYAASNISQQMPYHNQTVVTKNGRAGAAKGTGGAKTTDPKAASDKTTIDDKSYVVNGPLLFDNVNYNMSYVQIHPAVGVKILKVISMGAGPDFQKALADNRPTPSETAPEATERFPLFDVGLMGKAECKITKNMKAGVSYRKGVNSVIAPNANYIDRDYLQFQLNYAVFNK